MAPPSGSDGRSPARDPRQTGFNPDAFASLLTLSLRVLEWLFWEVRPHYRSSGGALKAAAGDSPEESGAEGIP